MLESVIMMARRNGLKVTAEGIETAEQSRLFGKLGCDTLQGYYYSRPLAPDQVMPFVASYAGSRSVSEQLDFLKQPPVGIPSTGEPAGTRSLKPYLRNALMKSNKLFWLTDQSFSRTISEVREHFDGIELMVVGSLDDLLSRIGEADCILASVPLSPMEVELLSAAPVIVWRDEFNASDAARAIRAGAFHCFDGSAPVEDVRDEVGAVLEEKNSRVAQRRRMSEPSEKWRTSLVGESATMNTVAEIVRLVAPKRCTVLISGETGTGKEMVARAIHMASPRAHMPMVSVNCTALPENLLEAELFGHTKGAFTGAASHRVGRFEQAHKSTLFLDEIGDMPLDLQAKLLRVLQEREFQRLGCSETTKVDVRVIAASNVDLVERVRQGKFREDLYYRLNVVPLKTPPLRSRREDIPALVAHFVTRICRAEDVELKRVAPGGPTLCVPSPGQATYGSLKTQSRWRSR